MNGCPPDEPTLNRFIQEIDRLSPRPHHSSLLEVAASVLPDCRFRFSLSRGGWHRPGGVIDLDGQVVAADMEQWLESELAACDEDIDLFLDRYAYAGLQLTRHAGQTHYFVAPYGPAPADCLQLEVEELQEVMDRLLINPEAPPTDVSELSEPFEVAALPHQPVGRPYYRFRRLVDIRRVSARAAAAIGSGGIPGEGSPLSRFQSDWASCAASDSGHFSDHWIVGLREHADAYGNMVINASPISLHARKLKHFHWQPDTRGVELGDQIHAFDRAAGYPSAWYFHLVAGGLVPREMAYVLMDDWLDGFRYLPDRDAALLKTWIEKPYSV